MTTNSHGKRALVTGGAGLIGSHVTDLLVREGWRVRIFDNLEPNTHARQTRLDQRRRGIRARRHA